MTDTKPNFPVKVSDLARRHSVSTSTIRRWIEDGFFIADTKAKPMLVVSGRAPVTPQQWRKQVEGLGMKRGLYGIEPCGDVEVLNGIDRVRITYSHDPRVADANLAALREVAERQRSL